MGLTIIDTNNIFHKDVIGNVRSAQEDSHDIAALTPNGAIFVVCDGMGGHVGGKQASSIAVKSIIEYLQHEKYPNPIQALNEALQFANMQILGYANQHPELQGMGTTACIVMMQESEAYIAHVGDSRIYLYLGKEKQLHRITKDHSFVQALVDAGEITDEEAELHPNKNRILKALGVKPELEPTFNQVIPKNGDIFLICSDGLSGMISDETMAGVLAQNVSIESKGETLIALALQAGGLDNITLELINISSSPHSKSRFTSYSPASNVPDNHLNSETSKFIKRFLIVATSIIFSIVIATGIWLLSHKLRQDNTQETLTKLELTIKEDSLNLSQTLTYFDKVKSDWEISAKKTSEALHVVQLNKKNNDSNEAYRLAQKATDYLKSQLDSIEAAVAAQRQELTKLKNCRDSIKATLTTKPKKK